MAGTDGTLAGHLRMKPMLMNCAIRGDWRGAIAGRGELTTWYDRFQKRWFQNFINDDGHPLIMSGQAEGAALVFTGVNTSFDGRVGLHRMTWSPLPRGGLRQFWEFSEDEGKTWNILIEVHGQPLRPSKTAKVSR